MAFNSFSDLFIMGKHGVFVWTTYAIIVFSIVTIHLFSRLRHRYLTRKLRALKRVHKP